MKITTSDELRALYSPITVRAKNKVLAELEQHSINFILHSPFAVLSTVGRDGKVDASPRGGEPGFVRIVNNKELLIPDSKGNNRLDSLVNIIETGQLGLLFIIPGIDETLRINGKAQISSDSDLIGLFSDEQNPPRTVLQVTVEEVFLHCAKAFMRSKLWSADAQIKRTDFPTMGQMLSDQMGEDDFIESQEDMVSRYQKDL